MFPPLGLHTSPRFPPLLYKDQTRPGRLPFRGPKSFEFKCRNGRGRKEHFKLYIHTFYLLKGEVGLETQSLKWRTQRNNWNFKHDQNCQGFVCVFTNSCVSLQIQNVCLYKFCIWNHNAASGKMKSLSVWHEVGV